MGHEELMGELKAVIGAGLAHELRSSAAASGATPASATPFDKVSTARMLDLQQDFLQKLLKSNDLRQNVVLVRRNLKALEARCARLTGHCERLDAQLAQTQQAAADLQSVQEHSPSPSRACSRTLSPRERRISVGSELLGALRGELAGLAVPTRVDVGTARSSSIPEMSIAELPAATAVSAGGTDASAGLAPNDALRQELEMLEVDFEREEAMRHLHIKEDNSDRQHWYGRAIAKLRDLDQAVSEEPLLYDLVQRRRLELLRKRENLTRRRQELQSKEHELGSNAHLEVHSAPPVCTTSNEDAKLQSKCLQLSETIIRLKDKNEALHEERLDRMSQNLIRAPIGGA